MVIFADPLPCTVVGKGSNFTAQGWRSILVSANFEFNVYKGGASGIRTPDPLPARHVQPRSVSSFRDEISPPEYLLYRSVSLYLWS